MWAHALVEWMVKPFYSIKIELINLPASKFFIFLHHWKGLWKRKSENKRSANFVYNYHFTKASLHYLIVFSNINIWKNDISPILDTRLLLILSWNRHSFCPSVGRSVGRSVCHFLKGRDGKLHFHAPVGAHVLKITA